MKKKTLWDKVAKTKVKDKQTAIEAFTKIVKEVEANNYNFQAGDVAEKNYTIVHETNRMNSFFVHVVPKELYKVFKKLQKEEPHSFLGFSILCGKMGEREVRVSCFGIPSTELVRAVIKK